jgi:hypothetical protein
MYPVGKIRKKESLLAGDTVWDLDRADVGHGNAKKFRLSARIRPACD